MKKIIVSLLIIAMCSCTTTLNLNLKSTICSSMVTKVLSTVCMVRWENNGMIIKGGTGSCIYKCYENDIEVAYILTARHVAQAPEHPNIIYDNIDENNKYPIIEPSPLQLKIYSWSYNSLGRVICDAVIYDAEVVWLAEYCDAAILKIKKPRTTLNTASIMSVKNCKRLAIGDKVICCSCPLLLPPLVNFGNIARFDLLMNNFGLTFDIIALNIVGGSSGGPIFLKDTYEILGIVSIGYGQPGITTHICGATPILNIINELSDTQFNFIME